MNCSIYLFGNFGRGYDQYLFDYTEPILSRFAKNLNAPTQLGIHREGNLIYYAYMRRLEDAPEHFIGLSCVVNGSGFCCFSKLFKVFENEMESIISQGVFVGFDNDGNIVPRTIQLSALQTEINTLSEHLKVLLSDVSSSQLPPYNYEISNDSVNKLVDTDPEKTIDNSINNYSYTYIYKNSDYDTNAITSYRGIIRGLKSDLDRQQQDIIELRKNNSKLIRQKKQTTIVLLLIGVLAVFVLGFVSFANDRNKKIKQQSLENDGLVTHVDKLQTDSTALSQYLSETTIELIEERVKNEKLTKSNANLSVKVEEQADTILNLRGTISDKDEKISSQETELSSLNTKVSFLTLKISSLESTITSLFSSTSKYVGANTTVESKSYDKTYRLWLHANKSIKIQSFWVKAEMEGTIIIGLYSISGQCIAEEPFKIKSSKQFVELVLSNFVIPTAGDYYLAIAGGDVPLSYHKSNEKEFNRYSRGNLQIIGVDTPRSSRTTNYYQYFYNIKYVD